MDYKPDVKAIQQLVGSATEEQLRFIDSFIYEDIGIFLPVAGPCYYALSPEHTHPTYMVVYSFNGESDGWVKGVQNSTLKAGEFILIAPDVKHQEEERSDVPKYIAVCIKPELFEHIAEEYNICHDLIRSSVKIAKAPKQFLSLCWQFLAEVKMLHKPKNSLLKAISVQICHTVIRSTFKMPGVTGQSEWRAEIGQSIAFMLGNLHDKLGLFEIANSANMSVPNFCRIFKKEIGQTPIGYLTEQRLHKAQKMLLSNDFSMQDIAASCGFSSVSYLSTTYKKRYKVSPEKYKLKNNRL